MIKYKRAFLFLMAVRKLSPSRTNHRTFGILFYVANIQTFFGTTKVFNYILQLLRECSFPFPRQ